MGRRSKKSTERRKEIGARLRQARESVIRRIIVMPDGTWTEIDPTKKEPTLPEGAEIDEIEGMSLREVVNRLDPPPVWQTLQKWETGAIEIPIDRIEQLAKIYRISPAELLQW